MAGSASQLDDLYRTYGPAIYGRCMRILGDAAAAEDATQETFVRVHRYLATVTDPRAALALIYRIATNYCLNEIRNRNLRARPTSEVGDMSASSPARLDDRDLVRRLAADLPTKLVAPAWLHHVDEMELSEIASVLRISRRTVTNRISAFHRAAKKFIARS